jgi:hypothetical protein
MCHTPNMDIIRRVARSGHNPRPSYDVNPVTGEAWAEDDEDKKPQGFSGCSPKHCRSCGRRWPYKSWLCGCCWHLVHVQEAADAGVTGVAKASRLEREVEETIRRQEAADA